MFEMLRKMIGPIMLLVLVAFLATIIFSWGGGGFRDKPRDTVGVIDGEMISFNTYDRYYTNLLRQAQQENDYELSSEKMDEIRNNAWQQLQADILIGREIEKRKIVVTSEEIYNFLKLYPPRELQSASQFMTDGAFDYQKYVNAMVNPENAPFWANLESYVLPDLKKYKLQEQIIGAVRVTPAEVMEGFLGEREKVKLGYINIKSNDFKSMVADATDDEVREYYNNHKENYKVDKRASIDYVLFSKAPSENDWQRILYEIKDIQDSAVAGSDFAELARTYSEDNSASNGGDLGWFKQGQMVPSFDSAVFSMRIGQISQPVKTQFGYHVIKLLGIKGDERNAAHILLKINASSETLDQIENNAADFAEVAREKGFKETAEEYSYEIKSSQKPFDKSGMISPEFGRNTEISEFANNNKVGDISEPFNAKSHVIVVKITEQIPAGYSTLEEVTINIKSDIKADKAKQKALDTANVVYGSIKTGASISNASSTYGFPYETTELIGRAGIVPNIGRADEVTGAAFALKNIDDISVPVSYRNGVVILKLLEKVSANIEEFNQIQDSLKIVTLQKKQQAMYNRWYQELFANAKIESYLSQFYPSY
jgi:peptidyl-prolyl cis-trans isomerase D